MPRKKKIRGSKNTIKTASLKRCRHDAQQRWQSEMPQKIAADVVIC